MTALNIFLAVVGCLVAAMVVTGMVFLKPHHITTPAPLTDLSDVQQRFGVPADDVPPVMGPAAPVAPILDDATLGLD